MSTKTYEDAMDWLDQKLQESKLQESKHLEEEKIIEYIMEVLCDMRNS